MDDITLPISNMESEALAALEAHARATDWLRHYPDEDPATVTGMFLDETRRELGLSE